MELTPPDQDIALRLSGLPDDAYLTAGTKLADSSWMLKRGEEMDIKLKVPSSQKSPLLIGHRSHRLAHGRLCRPTRRN